MSKYALNGLLSDIAPYYLQAEIVQVVSTVAQNCRQSWTTAFTPPWFSLACHRSFRLAARYLPRSRPQGEPSRNVTPWASDSPTTLTCMLIRIRAWPASLCRGVPQAGFSHPTCSRTGRQGLSATPLLLRRRLLASLPMPLLVKTLMDVDRGIEVRIGLILTSRAPEQLSPSRFDADCASVGEPLPPGSAS